ncbi:MAG: hypothetical protein P4L22_02530 [Candidatus Babeliales bacterium]|nr:hypothetical protein [Candidatus Babeliales bacterium]
MKIHKNFAILLLLLFNMYFCLNNSITLRHLMKSCEKPCVVDAELNLSRLGLTSIEGIELYPGIHNVKKLNLSHNNLTCLKPLVCCLFKDVANCEFNKLLSPRRRKSLMIAEPALKILDLANNNLIDISPLRELVMLEELYLENNQIDLVSLNLVCGALENLNTVVTDIN